MGSGPAINSRPDPIVALAWAMGTSEERRNIYKPKVLTCFHIAYGGHGYDAAHTAACGVCGITNRTSHTKEVSKMKKRNLFDNLGLLFLSIWLILTGLIVLFSLHFEGLPIIMGILAIAAGVLILLGK
jgi:hypothetical protein